MKFDSLQLHQFKCFERTGVSFRPGVTVVHGSNGSGKSTLLDACFFALYGSKALDTTTLDDVITTGTEEAAVELSFTHRGGRYDIRRELVRRGDRAQTRQCLLTGPDREIEGARAVRGAVAELLRMDAAAFLNCAYVRQGEVNKLIHASPAERQDMIDELLQLGRLEDYRDRATAVRRGIGSLRDERAGHLEGVRDQIASKEDRSLHDQLNERETKLAEIDAAIADLKEDRAGFEEQKADAEERLETLAEREEELERLGDQIESVATALDDVREERTTVTSAISETTEERNELQRTLRDRATTIDLPDAERETIREALQDLRERDETYQESLESARLAVQEHRQEAETASERAEEQRNRATELEDRRVELDSEIEELEAQLEDRREALEDHRERRDELLASIREAGHDPDELETVEANLATRIESIRDDEQDLESERRALEQQIESAEALRDEGNCPTCGQPVVDAPPVESIGTDRQRLAELEEELSDRRKEREALEDERDAVEDLRERRREAASLTDRIESQETLLSDKASTLAATRERLTEVREKQSDTSEAAAVAAERASSAREAMAEARAEVGSINAQREELQSDIGELEELLEIHEQVADLESTLAERRTRLESLDELREERTERLRDLKSERATIAAELDPERIQEAKETRRNAAERLETIDEELDSLAQKRDALLDQVGRLRNELDELESLRDQRDALEERLDRLAVAHEDAATLESMYGELRADLRERNLRTLDRLVNETFDLVYQNDAYDRIDLDEEYGITVYQKDGEPLAPEQLSGGERALFNLSLRCAIYRLLAEGIDGTAPLPPLILDEPTVYLDAGHVGKLVELIDAMRSMGVEQIIVVSHDRELLRAADATIAVEKDPTTNRSSATIEDPVSPLIDS